MKLFPIYRTTPLFFACLWAISLPAEEAATSTVFGKTRTSEAALIGIMYDLKQNQKREKVTANYLTVVGEFMRSGWDESVLNRFYRVTQPLYTTQIYVPPMNADSAPKAFKVEELVKPRAWLIHYKGQVSPPKDGNYRFVGMADDTLAVAVNGKTVLLGDHPGSRTTNPGWSGKRAGGPKCPPDPAVNGDWLTLKKEEPIDLDIIIGERPGGWFGAWLMIEEQGGTYEKDAQGKPILPLFQLSAVPAPDATAQKKGPKVIACVPPWKAYQ